MTDDLEQNSEQDEAEVGPSDQFPREAVKETNLVADNGRWASLLAERASAVRHFVVAIKNTVGRHWILAWHGFRVELAFSDAQISREIDVGITVWGTVITEEV
jgi:hypothetical protein